MRDLCCKINSLHAGAIGQLDKIREFPESASKMIVEVLLDEACRSQHIGKIVSAQELMIEIEPLWLSTVLHDAIEDVVDLKDEWEYRRLIELLKKLKSPMFDRYISYGIASSVSVIREAARDLSNK